MEHGFGDNAGDQNFSGPVREIQTAPPSALCDIGQLSYSL